LFQEGDLLSLSVIEPWKIQADLEANRRIVSLDEDKIVHNFCKLSYTEICLGEVHNRLGHCKIAEDYCDVAISHGKRVILE
jgi:hypothetical protein